MSNKATGVTKEYKTKETQHEFLDYLISKIGGCMLTDLSPKELDEFMYGIFTNFKIEKI